MRIVSIFSAGLTICAMISGSFSDISYWLLETFPALATIG